MAARTSPAKVKELIPTQLSDETVRGSMIHMANTFVTDHLTNAGLSTAALANIELLLAAHFVSLVDERGGLISDEIGEASQDMANIYGSGFNATRFGQQAMVLDISGTLTNLGNSSKLKAEFRVV